MTLLVKTCGLNAPAALEAALEAGADLVGFVFFAPSPRQSATRRPARSASRCAAAPARSRFGWRVREGAEVGAS